MTENVDQSKRPSYGALRVLVALAVLLVLFLGVVMFNARVDKFSSEQDSKEIVKQLEMIAVEYQTLTGTMPAPDMRTFVAETQSDLAHMYTNFHPDLYDGVTAQDAWGHEIRYVHPTASPDPKLGKHATFYFASPGPDGQWGDVTAQPDSEAFKHSQDNIRSFDVGK